MRALAAEATTNVADDPEMPRIPGLINDETAVTRAIGIRAAGAILIGPLVTPQAIAGIAPAPVRSTYAKP